MRWSWRLLFALAAVWSFVALAFFLSWIPEADQTDLHWTSEAVWYGGTYLLWFLFSPLVFFLAKAFPVPGDRPLRNIGVHVLAAMTLGAAHFLLFMAIDHTFDPDFRTRFPSVIQALKNGLFYRSLTGMATYGLVVLAFTSDAAFRRVRLEERRSEALKHELAEAQLQTLRMQIQPHFLFNTLHSISALIYESPPAALTVVSRLGDFLRATLERGRVQTIRFEEELEFAMLYLEIEKVRFGDRLSIHVEVSPEVRDARTPTLILQPLVENAIRHGVAHSTIPVDLAIKALARDGQLQITLQNGAYGVYAAASGSAPVEGLGLSNTRARLYRAYGNRASLSCSQTPGAFLVGIRLPLQKMSEDDG